MQKLDIAPYEVRHPDELSRAVAEQGLGVLALDAITPQDMLSLVNRIGEPRPEYSDRSSEHVYGGVILRIAVSDPSDKILSHEHFGLHIDEPMAPPHDAEPPDDNGPEWHQLGQPYANVLGCEKPPEPQEGGQTLFFDSRHLYYELDEDMVEILEQSYQRLTFPDEDVGERIAHRPVLSGSREHPEIAYSDKPDGFPSRLVDSDGHPIGENTEREVIKAMREIFPEYTKAIPWEPGLAVAWRNTSWLHGRTEQVKNSRRSLLRGKVARPHDSAGQTLFALTTVH